MESGKIKSTIVDYFLLLSSIIGVGFASGKEICVFFFNFGSCSMLSLLAFGLLYIYLFYIVQHISNKLKLNSFDEFNTKIFGKLCKCSNIVLLVNFSITSAGMMAGCDYLFATFFNVSFRIPSIVLSALIFIVLLGGIEKIKTIANLIIPVMLSAIVINGLKNISPSNINLPIISQSGVMAVYYGLLFGVNNFIACLPILFETKLKFKGKIAVILTICLIILLNILVLASTNFATDMPLFEVSANVSKMFYYVYFETLLLAIFSTLMICCFNIQKILCPNNRCITINLSIILWCLAISNLGYNFIVKYLYVASGIISGIYVVAMIVMIIVNLIKNNSAKEVLQYQDKIKKQNIN